MPQVQLIHWNDAEAKERASRLKKLGYQVAFKTANYMDAGKKWRESPPSAFVIDLSRLPSHGRQIAFWLRSIKGTRQVPLVFVDGEPEKVARTRELISHACFTTWEKIEKDLKKTLANPPKNLPAPQSSSGAYSGTPLPKKLGIRENGEVALIGAPPNFEKILGTLPEGAKIFRQVRSPEAITLWFLESEKNLRAGLKKMVTLAERGGLWLVWPKKSSGVKTDLHEGLIRDLAIRSGLVDYKVCAVDATWSGLKFSKKKKETS